MPSNPIYRTDDKLEWSSYDDALKHEKRIETIKKHLDEVGGELGLARATTRQPSHHTSFLCRYIREPLNEIVIAIYLEELVAIGKWAEKVLAESGPCPLPNENSLKDYY